MYLSSLALFVQHCSAVAYLLHGHHRTVSVIACSAMVVSSLPRDAIMTGERATPSLTTLERLPCPAGVFYIVA